MIIVHEVQGNKQMKVFIECPYVLNKEVKNWVPPLRISLESLFDLEKNPFWNMCEHTFIVATKKKKIVGRIGVMIHHEYNKLNAVRTGFFGFLEAIDEKEVFQKLLGKAEEWLKYRNCEKIIGPVNPSINYEIGTLIKGFEFPPNIMMTYNLPYHSKNVEACGYLKEMDFFAYYTGKDAPVLSSKLDRIIELTKKKYTIQIRNVKKKEFYNELGILHGIYNEAFSDHYGFVPMTLEEFAFMGKDLAQIVNEELLMIAEYKNEPIGFILALLDYNEVFAHIKNGKLFPFGWLKFLYYRNRIKNIRVLTIAVKSKFKHMGIGAYFYKEMIKRAAKKNIFSGEMSWIAENNIQMNKAAKEMGAVVNKTYRLYFKNL